MTQLLAKPREGGEGCVRGRFNPAFPFNLGCETPSILGDLFEFPTYPHGNGLEFFSDHKDLAETIVGAELKTLDRLMHLEEGGNAF